MLRSAFHFRYKDVKNCRTQFLVYFYSHSKNDCKTHTVPTFFRTKPSLVFLFRPQARDKQLRWLAVIALVVLTFVLWCHGNPGGWQYSYRYAMVLLPWMMLLLIENSPSRVSLIEWLLFILSVGINAWATYLFLQSEYMRY